MRHSWQTQFGAFYLNQPLFIRCWWSNNKVWLTAVREGIMANPVQENRPAVEIRYEVNVILVLHIVAIIFMLHVCILHKVEVVILPPAMLGLLENRDPLL